MCILWQFAVNILNRTDGSLEWASVVVAVKGVQQRTVFADKSRFCGGRAGIDTKITVAGIGTQLTCFYVILALSFGKFFIIFLGRKKRFHTGNLKFQFYCLF